MKASISRKQVSNVDKKFLPKLTFDDHNNTLRGPSKAPVWDKSQDSWTPIIKNVTSEGYPEGVENVLVSAKSPRVDHRTILRDYPIWDKLPKTWKVVQPTKPNRADKKKKSEMKKH